MTGDPFASGEVNAKQDNNFTCILLPKRQLFHFGFDINVFPVTFPFLPKLKKTHHIDFQTVKFVTRK